FRGSDAVARFEATHAGHTAVVHEAFAALFHGAAEARRRERDPAIDALLETLDDPEATHTHLARLGFADPTTARGDLRLLHDGPPHAPPSARRRAALAAPDLEAALDTLRRFRNEEFLRIGVHDIQDKLGAEEVTAQLTWLAETCLEAALAIARREVLARTGLAPEPSTAGLAVLGMGTLG